jgi:hypothetical protein
MSEEKVVETARWLMAHTGTMELHTGGRGRRALLSSHSGFVAYPLVQLLHSASATTAPPLLHLVLWLTRTSPELLVIPSLLSPLPAAAALALPIRFF